LTVIKIGEKEGIDMNNWDDWEDGLAGISESDKVFVYGFTDELIKWNLDQLLDQRKLDKQNRAEVFTFKAERVLREIAIDFGLEFERDRRQRIEDLIKKLRFCLAQADEVGRDAAYSDLSQEIYEINYAAYLYNSDDDDDAAYAVVRR
jgi:hypothetical protein